MRNKLGKILESIINDHKIKSQGNGIDQQEEDFVDVLLKLQQSKELELTTDQIKDVIMDIFSAGSETTATTIEWAMSELMRNPRVMNKAQAEVRRQAGKPKIEEAELEYLKAIVKETLRLHPPGPLLPRESRERCEIGGYEFPSKTKVLINEWAIGRDPESWVEAESFKPERFLHVHGSKSESVLDFKGFDFEFIPFGAGRRICPGMSFGISMIEATLSQLLYYFFDWQLPNGIKPNELHMTEAFGITCRRKHDLYVIATPHSFSSTSS
ncbi:hypothetical protein M0R45_033843 [Rubus argutus]|uniref:Cytochrome P450 n=1 Tax=Rubus argutus TaxID=59490 RepID=A0AAW1WNK5_RUBAR